MINFLRVFLFPFSIIWFCIISIRHFLYNKHILNSYQSNQLKTIVVGNLDLGGTGKTPFVEMLLQHFNQFKKIAVLSRGYGRKTKGFLKASVNNNFKEIGDEPKQILLKFPHLPFFVCENRVSAIKNIENNFKEIEWVILDDALQHRALNPNINILLTDYNNLFYDNYLLPTGTLRDVKARANNVTYVVVTKCPNNITIEKAEQIKTKIKLYTNAEVYFSTIEYDNPYSFKGEQIFDLEKPVTVFSGLANAQLFNAYCKEKYNVVKVINFPDHHAYKQTDLDFLSNNDNLFITTQKDAVKITDLDFEIPKEKIFVLPIRTKILFNQSNEFFTDIINRLS